MTSLYALPRETYYAQRALLEGDLSASNLSGRQRRFDASLLLPPARAPPCTAHQAAHT